MTHKEKATERVLKMMADLPKDKKNEDKLSALRSVLFFLDSDDSIDMLNGFLHSLTRIREAIHNKMEDSAVYYFNGNEKQMAAQRSKVARQYNLPDINYKIKTIQEIIS